MFKWKIKCIKCEVDRYWAIGLASASDEIYESIFYYTKEENTYAFEASGTIFNQGGCALTDTPGWCEGDHITLSYEGIDRVLSISINDSYVEESKIEVEDNPDEFRMAVYLGSVKDKVELVCFEQH